MNIRGVFIEETFAEAFTMRVARIVITARSPRATASSNSGRTWSRLPAGARRSCPSSTTSVPPLMTKRGVANIRETSGSGV